MIVRISGEGQYRLAVDEGREDDFASAFAAVLSYVREQGELLGDDELESSAVILPPADATFKEAASEFTGEGLIPD